jgi:tRNA (adenine22-N1)-methyltransferase
VINSNRIEKICSLVSSNTVAEIGCDHAYILKNLFETKPIDCAFATDISNLCLNKARKNLSGYLHKVYFYVGDGLDPLEDVLGPKVAKFVPVDIIIAGMGGKEIIKILENATKFHRENVTFILQPQKNCDMVRKFLMEHNFLIEQDIVAKDGKMFYNILSCKINYEQNTLTDEQIEFGLGTQKDSDFYEYLSFEKAKCERILSKKKVARVQRRLDLLKKICKENKNV